MKSVGEVGLEKENQSYTTSSLQLLDLMDTLFSRIGRIFTKEAVARLETEAKADNVISGESEIEALQGCGGVDKSSQMKSAANSGGLLWQMAWCPLLQGMARMCCDTRKSVRQTAITYLQRALLAHELQNLTSLEWEACFLQVFFPMLSRLLEVTPIVDQFNLEETRVRASNLLCKVFLQHLLSLSSLPHFPDLWFGILDFMEKYLCLGNSDLLSEAIPESLKNMLLVMSTQGVLDVSVSNNRSGSTVSLNENNTSLKLLEMTWLRIEQFLPQFMKQLFPAIIPPTPQSPPQDPVPQVTPSPNHTLPSQPSAQFPLEAVVVQEIPVTVTMDHMTGGVSMAATPIQTPCSPSRSPDPSPHASPPTSSSPVAELQAKGEVSLGNFPITLHPPLPTVAIPTSQGQETNSISGTKQELILVQPAPQDSPTAVPVSSVLNL